MTEATEAMACAVCGYVVDTYGDTDEFGTERVIGYRHGESLSDDHPVVPVPVASIRVIPRCDFCLSERNVRWRLPAGSFRTTPEDFPGPEQHSAGDWAACDVCAACLRRQDWDRLVDRGYRTHRRLYPNEPRFAHDLFRGVIRGLYNDLRAHQLGPVRLNTGEVE